MSLGIRPPVLLIGAHRSGTSATAKALRHLGLFIGHPENNDHHDESFFFIHLHDNWLHQCGADWFQPDAYLEQLKTPGGREACRDYLAFHTNGRYGVGPLRGQSLARRFGEGLALDMLGGRIQWGWKDPRTTLFVLPWLDVFPGAKVVHILRHPLDAALSLQRREQKWQREGRPYANHRLQDLDAAFTLVNQYVACGLEAASIGANYHEVRFEDIQENPQSRLQQLAEFCGLKPDAETLVEAAGAIEGDRQARWRDLPAAEVARLMAQSPYAERFGYAVSAVNA